MGPAAVMIVALRISVGRDGNGVYVLGNGLAKGTDVDPGSALLVSVLVLAVLFVLRAGDGACVFFGALAQPSATAHPRRRLGRRIQ